MKKKNTSFLIMLALVATLLSASAAFGLEPLHWQAVTISCDTFRVDRDTITIMKTESIRFVRIDSTCTTPADSIKISGTAPIGTFVLKNTKKDSLVVFPDTGSFLYQVIIFPSSPGDTLNDRLVRVRANLLTPFLDTRGIIVLLLLLAATAWFVLSRRKVRTTGSVA